MSPSDDKTNYMTCSCQHCSGHIKFDPSQLHKGETRTVECPHCHLETILFIPQTSQPSPKTEDKRIIRKEHTINENLGATTKVELFVLRLTRIITLAGAALTIVALAVITLIFSVTFLPERPETIRSISYEEIVSALQPNPSPSQAYLATGNQINSAETIPQPVATFIGSHPDFPLDVAQMTPYQRGAFLNNLATVIQKANANHVSDTELVQIVSQYVNIWTTINAPKPTEESFQTKKYIRTFCLTATPILLGAMTILCLILVLFAIERSIRRIAEKEPNSQNNS